MNDINVAKAAVDKQKESLSAAAKKVEQAKSAYLQSMVHTAVLNEKLRRKKDSLAKLLVWGGAGIIGLILFAIHMVAGILFIAVVAGMLCMGGGETVEDKAANDNGRKEFFSKYASAISAKDADQIGWKNEPVSSADNTNDSEDN